MDVSTASGVTGGNTLAPKDEKDLQVEDISETARSPTDATPEIQGEIWHGVNRQTVMAFLAISTQLAAYEMALIIPAVSAGVINADLGPSPNYIWMNISWTLGAAVLVSVSGRLSDIFGRRYFMLAGAFISFIGTIIGATGQSIAQMIVSGVFFGIGSGVQEMGFACIMEFIPNKYRLTALGLYGSFAFPCICTPLLAYVFMSRTALGWRSSYWFMTGWHGFGIIFMFCFYHPPSFKTKHQHDRVSRWKLVCEMDYVGLVLFIASCTTFLVGINAGGRQYPWQSAKVIAPMVVGVALMVILFVWEFNAKLQYPLLPPKLFRQWRGYNVLVLIGFCCGMLYYSMQVMWPRQSALLFVPATDPIMRGVYANITLWGTWASLMSVWLICARFAHEKRQIIFFICCQAAFVGGLSSLGINDKGKAIGLVFAMSCVINQPLYMLFSMVSLNIEDQSDIGVAIGAISTFRLLGGAIATAVYTSIVDNQFADRLPAQIKHAIADTSFDPANLGVLIKAASLNTAAAYKKVPGITSQVISASQLGVKLAYSQSYRVVYLTALGFAAVALLSAMLCSSVDPAKKTLDKAVLLENEKVVKDCE